MLRTTYLLGVVMLLSALALPSAAAELEFEKKRHDFGEIGHYDKPEVTFTFTNVGDAPVEIKIVKSSSTVGRTTPPEGEIAPGETGDILVKTRTRYGGPFRIHLEVIEKTDGNVAQLIVTGNVLAKEDSIKPSASSQ